MTNHVLKHENKTLSGILAQISQLQHLNSLLGQHLTPEIAKHCRVAKFDRDCLIVIVENGNWATQLRFQIPELLTQLRQYPILQNLNGICCKTRPSYTPSKAQKSPPRSVAMLTAQTSAVVLETAKTISDSKLRSIIERIARRCETE